MGYMMSYTKNLCSVLALLQMTISEKFTGNVCIFFYLSQELGLRETFMKIMILSLMQEVKESLIDLY